MVRVLTSVVRPNTRRHQTAFYFNLGHISLRIKNKMMSVCLYLFGCVCVCGFDASEEKERQ